MSHLLAKFDKSQDTLTFSGSGTFDAKESIKALGKARWDGVNKAWVVKGCRLAKSELETLFPSLELVGDYPSQFTSNTDSRESNSEQPADQGLDVSQLLQQASLAIKKQFPKPVLVKGLIQKVKASKHVFIELRDIEDDSVQVSCVIWQSDYQKIQKQIATAGFELEADLEVMFEVAVGLNPRRGDLSLNIRSIVVEYTLGKIAAVREKTNEQLKKEGIFNKNKSLELAFYPKRLGLVTSGGGTVINDFRNGIDGAPGGFELFWLKTSVQGSSAKAAIIKAINYFSSREDIDAVLIFRGGGSKSELAVFSDLEISRAVCNCAKPVFSAIGHQEDECSVQDVSYKTFGVPKDLGIFFKDYMEGVREQFADYCQNIVDTAHDDIERKKVEIKECSYSLLNVSKLIIQKRKSSLLRLIEGIPKTSKLIVQRAKSTILNRAISIPLKSKSLKSLQSKRLEQLSQKLSFSTRTKLEFQKNKLGEFRSLINQSKASLKDFGTKLDGFVKLLEALSPKKQLQLGYTIIRGEGGQIVPNGGSLAPGQSVEIEFYDIKRKAQIGD